MEMKGEEGATGKGNASARENGMEKIGGHMWSNGEKRRHRILDVALTGVAQWVGHCPAVEKVTGSIPSQGTSLG